MIRAKEGRNMPITSKVTPCTQQPVQATEIHSLSYHSKQQSLTIPVVIYVSESIFLCVHSSVLYVRWEVETQHFTNICT